MNETLLRSSGSYDAATVRDRAVYIVPGVARVDRIRRRLLAPAISTPVMLCWLVSPLGAQSPAKEPAARSLSLLAQPSVVAASQSPWRFSGQLQPELVQTKMHLRLGSASVAGTDVAARESGLLSYRPAMGLRAQVVGPDPLLGGSFTAAFAYNFVQIEGGAELTPHAWGGQTITRLETEATLQQFDFELRHHVRLSPGFSVEVGGAIENRAFHADFRTDAGPSQLDLNGSCFAPSLRANLALGGNWWANCEIAGYVIRQIDRDRDRLDDLKRFGIGLRWQSDSFALDFGFRQQEADLVQDHNQISESFLHSRLSSFFLGVSLYF